MDSRRQMQGRTAASGRESPDGVDRPELASGSDHADPNRSSLTFLTLNLDNNKIDLLPSRNQYSSRFEVIFPNEPTTEAQACCHPPLVIVRSCWLQVTWITKEARGDVCSS